MARYFLSLTDDQGVLLGRFVIESDTEAVFSADDDEELYGPRSFGEDVEEEIKKHQRQQKETS